MAYIIFFILTDAGNVLSMEWPFYLLLRDLVSFFTFLLLLVYRSRSLIRRWTSVMSKLDVVPKTTLSTLLEEARYVVQETICYVMTFYCTQHESARPLKNAQFQAACWL